MTAGCTFQYGLAYLIPALRHGGFSLELASVLVACPTVGLLLTLIGWGAAADRWGERVVLASGLGLAGLVLLALPHSCTAPSAWACAWRWRGAAGGSVFAASGRLSSAGSRGTSAAWPWASGRARSRSAWRWRPPRCPRWRGRYRRPLLFLGGFCLVAAVLVVALVRDPARPQAPPRRRRRGSRRRASPYRQPVLWRIHAASALLVVPQFTVATFALVFLSTRAAGTAPAAGRLLAGRAARRRGRPAWGRLLVRPGGQPDAADAHLWRHAPALACSRWLSRRQLGHRPRFRSCSPAAVVAVSTNGLAFTAVAEYAGSAWAGRALGDPEHRAERPGCGHAARPGAGHRLDRLWRLVRDRGRVPAGGCRLRARGLRRRSGAAGAAAKASARRRAASGSRRTHPPAPPP